MALRKRSLWLPRRNLALCLALRKRSLKMVPRWTKVVFLTGSPKTLPALGPDVVNRSGMGSPKKSCAGSGYMPVELHRQGDALARGVQFLLFPAIAACGALLVPFVPPYPSNSFDLLIDCFWLSLGRFWTKESFSSGTPHSAVTRPAARPPPPGRSTGFIGANR